MPFLLTRTAGRTTPANAVWAVERPTDAIARVDALEIVEWKLSEKHGRLLVLVDATLTVATSYGRVNQNRRIGASHSVASPLRYTIARWTMS